MTLSKAEQEYVKYGVTYGMKTSEMSYIIMTHRTRINRKHTIANHTLRDVQNEFTTLKIEINKVLAKL